jgi:transposase
MAECVIWDHGSPSSKGLDVLAINVTAEQLVQLHEERFHHPHPRVQKKMETIYLRAQGLAVGEVCRLVGISANTYRAYLRDFQAGGVDGLKRFDCEGTTSELDGHADQIIEALVERPPRTLAETRQRIIDLTGVERSREQVRQFLRRQGFRPLKVGSMPAKADVEVQAAFKKSP